MELGTRVAWFGGFVCLAALVPAACAGRITVTDLDDAPDASVVVIDSSSPSETSTVGDTSTTDAKKKDSGPDVAPPPHACDTTLAALAVPGTLAATTTGATDIDSASCAADSKGPETIQRLTIATKTGVIFAADGTGSTPVLSVRDVCKTDSSDQGRCASAAVGAGKVVLRTVLEPGTYYVVADQQLTSGQSEPYTLTASTFTPAPNNTCASAVAITQPDAGAVTLTADTNAGLLDSTPCNSFAAGRVYYTVSLKSGQKCTAKITPKAGANWRVAASAFASCTASACTSTQAATADGQAVTLTLTNDWSQPPTTMKIAVNATDPTLGGEFDLSATFATLPKCALNAANGTQCGGTGALSHCCGSTASVEGTCKANNDVTSCGSSCTPCPARANATASCNGTTCGFTCLPGYADCDGIATNGCEIDTKTNLANCGGCTKLPTTDKRCLSADVNAIPKCTNGACENPPACKAPYARCGGTTCSVNLTTSTTHCLQCNSSCARANASGATCGASGCTGWTCNAGFGNCTGGTNSWTDGCETNLDTDPSYCGSCSTSCYEPTRAGTCAGGTCGQWECTFGNCPVAGNPANGCSAMTALECGVCGSTCAPWLSKKCCPGNLCLSTISGDPCP